MQNNEIKIICPICGKPIKIEITEALIINDEFDIKRLQKSFIKTCPKCKEDFKTKHHLMLNNTERSYLIYYQPNASLNVMINKELESKYSFLSEIKKRLVIDLRDAEEKVNIFSYELDDMPLEIAKAFKVHKLETEKNIKIQKAYFDYYDQKDQIIGYIMIIDGNEYYETGSFEDYLLCKKYLENNNSNNLGFLRIDANWAKGHLKI